MSHSLCACTGGVLDEAQTPQARRSHLAGGQGRVSVITQMSHVHGGDTDTLPRPCAFEPSLALLVQSLRPLVSPTDRALRCV